MLIVVCNGILKFIIEVPADLLSKNSGRYIQFSINILMYGFIWRDSSAQYKSGSFNGEIEIFHVYTLVPQYVKSTQQSSTSKGK